MSKLLIPNQELDRLVCLVCQNSLSVFPIYTKGDGSGGICGRCQRTENDEFIRDEAYESIAKFFSFPCGYKVNGCLASELPSKLIEHERSCNYRELFCPSRCYTDCQWLGPRVNIITHLRENHSALFLEEPKFEVNFTESVQEKLLLIYDNEIFILQKKIDSEVEQFQCSMEHLECSKNSGRFYYSIRFENSEKSASYKTVFKSTTDMNNNSIKVCAPYLINHLVNPNSITAFIDMKRNADIDDCSEVIQSGREQNVRLDLLAEIACPVCYDYMVKPIYQCVNGHSTCKHCKVNLKMCPICRQLLADTRNFTLEKLTELLIYPCKFQKYGCSYSSKCTYIEAHEDSCEFGSYNCPLENNLNCQWKSNKNDLPKHIAECHINCMLLTDTLDIPFNEQINQNVFRLIMYSKRIFKMLYKFQNGKFYWLVQLIGTANECKRFKYEIDIIDQSGYERGYICKGLIVPLSTKNVDNESDKYLMLTFEQLQSFIKEYFSFKIRIIKV